MDFRINRIKQKIENKNIQKNEVISIDKIKNFEKLTNIKLPQELVLFYTEICNGCKMIDNFSLLRMEDWKYNAKNLKKDFLFEKYWIWEDDYDEDRIKCILDGNIELIDIGDAQSWHIIVNGSEREKCGFFQM